MNATHLINTRLIQKETSPATIVHLESGIIELPKRPLTFEVIKGIAWVTANGEDIIVNPGQTAEVPSTSTPALVSNVSKYDTLVYAIS